MNRKELTVFCHCPFCGNISEVSVNRDDYDSWASGELLAQEAFPYLSATDREKMISGLCEKCQGGIFD
jgi:hypothetical protein